MNAGPTTPTRNEIERVPYMKSIHRFLDYHHNLERVAEAANRIAKLVEPAYRELMHKHKGLHYAVGKWYFIQDRRMIELMDALDDLGEIDAQQVQKMKQITPDWTRGSPFVRHAERAGWDIAQLLGLHPDSEGVLAETINVRLRSAMDFAYQAGVEAATDNPDMKPKEVDDGRT